MKRYQIIKKMRKMLIGISDHVQNNSMSEEQLKNTVSELEKCINILMKGFENQPKPYNLVGKINRFLDALKHHYGIQQSNNAEILKMTDLKGFLHGELGIPLPKDNYFVSGKEAIPLNMLLI